MQLALLNAGSVMGRLLPNFLADRIGVYNMIILSIFMSMILLFSMFGVHDLNTTIIFGLLFGFSSGACKYSFYIQCVNSDALWQMCRWFRRCLRSSVPMWEKSGEFKTLYYLWGTNDVGSIRMGLAFSIVAFSMLVGTPIEGALLGHDFVWLRPIIFCGVCTQPVLCSSRCSWTHAFRLAPCLVCYLWFFQGICSSNGKEGVGGTSYDFLFMILKATACTDTLHASCP
jgi:hypothetical protein